MHLRLLLYHYPLRVNNILGMLFHNLLRVNQAQL